MKRSATVIDEAQIEEDDESQDKVIRVENLVKEFLSAQTLSVLEENGLGEAIESFVDKDDKRALADFIEDTLKEHVDVRTLGCFVDCRIWLRVTLMRKILTMKSRGLRRNLLLKLPNGERQELILHERGQLTKMISFLLLLFP